MPSDATTLTGNIPTTYWPYAILTLTLTVMATIGFTSSPPLWADTIEEAFQTELVYSQQKGAVQFTLAPQFSKGAQAKSSQLGLILEYGITDQWQFEVELPPYSYVNSEEGTNHGVGDIEIGSKYTWMNITDHTHAALAIEIQFPTGDINKELTEGFITYEPSLIIARDFPDTNNLQLFLQTGFGFVNRSKHHENRLEDEPAAHEFTLNLGFFLPLESVTWTMEANWSTNSWNNKGEENERFLTPGLVWAFQDTVELGVGIPIGLNDDADDYRIIGLLTVEWD